jgi:hypothetical protein
VPAAAASTGRRAASTASRIAAAATASAASSMTATAQPSSATMFGRTFDGSFLCSRILVAATFLVLSQPLLRTPAC